MVNCINDYSRLLVTLEVLVAAECLGATRVVTLAHGTANNVDSTIVLLRVLSRSTDLSSLQLCGAALNLMNHHLTVGSETARRGRGALEIIASNG